MAGAEYTIRRKVLTLFGAKFHIYNAEDALIGFSKQKAFKLKEDIRVYTDETMSEERLVISARSIIDISAAYDVTDSKTGTKIGSLQRQGMKSMLRDSWLVRDENEMEIGKIQEDSMGMALLRRFLSNLVPQKFAFAAADGNQFAEFRTHFNPFVHRMTVSVEEDCPVSPLLVLAAGILLVAIEGRQD